MEVRLIATPLDYSADCFGLVRFVGESDESFSRRLAGFYRREPTHTYKGLVEAASLEIGVPILPYIDINSTIPSSYIEVSPTGFTCSNDLETLVFESFTLDVSGNWQIVSGFSSIVSGVSGSVTFSIEQPISYYDMQYPAYTSEYVCMTFNPINLLFSNNRETIKETHSTYKYLIELDYLPLRGTFKIDYQISSFYSEVSTLTELSKAGDYYVDYDLGFLYLYRYDEFQNIDYNEFDIFQISYVTSKLPFRLYLVPIQMFSFIDPILQPFMYNVYDNKLDTWDRIEFPMVTDIINEIRTQNVNY